MEKGKKSLVAIRDCYHIGFCLQAKVELEFLFAQYHRFTNILLVYCFHDEMVYRVLGNYEIPDLASNVNHVSVLIFDVNTVVEN